MEELKVKITAEIEGFEDGVKEAKVAMGQLDNESKKSKNTLKQLENVIKAQEETLKALKKSYTNVVLEQGKSSEAAKTMLAQYKKVNEELLKSKALMADASSNPIFGDMGSANGELQGATANVEDLYRTMEQVKGLQFADIIFENIGAISKQVDKVRKQVQLATSGVKQAAQEVSQLGSPKYWKGALEESNSLKEVLSTIGQEAKNAGSSLASGFTSAKKAVREMNGIVKTAMSSTIAKIIAATAAIMALVAAVKLAINVANKMKTAFYQASAIGLNTAEYQKWAYIMESVGGSIDDVADAIKTLSAEQATLAEGAEGNTKAFEALGMSVDEVVKMSQGELFAKTITSLQNVKDEVQRTTLAYLLFGEDGAAKLANILSMSSGSVENMARSFRLLGGEASGKLVSNSLQLSQAIANMKVAFQGLGNTLAQWIMPVITKVVRWITIAVAKLNMLIRAILGYDIVAKGTGSKGAASGMDGFTQSTNGAIKAVEKLKRSTMGFDELNVMQDNSSSSADTGISGGGSMPSLGDAGDMFGGSLLSEDDLAGLDKFAEKVEEMRGKIQAVAIITGVLFALWQGPAILNFIKSIGTLIVKFGLLLAAKIADKIETLALMALYAKDFVVNMAKAAAALVVNIGQWIANTAVMVATTAATVAHTVATTAATAATWLFNAALTVLTSPITLIVVAIAAVIAIIVLCIKHWDDIKEAISKAIDAIVGFLKKGVEKLKGFVDKIINFVKENWQGLLLLIVNPFAGAFKLLYDNCEGFRNMIDKLVAKIKGFFDGLWDGLKKGAKNAWQGVKDAFSSVADWFKNIFTKAWEGVKKVFSTGGKIFSGIKEGIAETFKTVVNGIISGINTIIAVPFNAINGMLNKIRNIEFLEISPFKKLWKQNPLSVPQIPKLATGGITTGSTIANIGEAGREAILPLENNTQWMDALADRIAARNTAPTKVVLKVGEKELGWAAINGINNITKQTGNIQLAL